MRFVGIVLLVVAIVVALFAFNTPERDRLVKQFGVETWTCAEMIPDKSVTKSVGWVARDGGLALMVSSRMSMSFMGLSCRVRVGEGRCAAFRGKWKRVAAKVTVGSKIETISFDRRSDGVDGSWFDLAPLSNEIAARMVAALGHGSRAEIEVEADDGSRFRQALALGGFNEAMNRCGYW